MISVNALNLIVLIIILNITTIFSTVVTSLLTKIDKISYFLFLFPVLKIHFRRNVFIFKSACDIFDTLNKKLHFVRISIPQSPFKTFPCNFVMCLIICDFLIIALSDKLTLADTICKLFLYSSSMIQWPCFPNICLILLRQSIWEAQPRG